MPAQIAMLDGLGKRRRSRRRSRRFNGPVSIGYLGADGDEVGGSKMPWILAAAAVVSGWWFFFRNK